MGKYSIEISKEAKKHLAFHYKSGNKATINKIGQIFRELSDTPYTGEGSPELLKYEYAGYWSRRLNKKDRIIYQVNEDVVTVFVVSAKGHYQDR